MPKDEKVYFYKGSDNVLEKAEKENREPLDRIRESFGKVLDGKNLSFLLGSGCSSFIKDSFEVGVPTMVPMAKEFYTNVLDATHHAWLKSEFKIDLTLGAFSKNLEFFLGTLHSIYFYFDSTKQECSRVGLRLNHIIEISRNYIIEKCLNEKNKIAKIDQDLSTLYEVFYRKLLYRNSNLPKPNIFTTNYDIYTETALDKLGVHYVNGFSGGIKKYFNPTIFNYALAEKMDLSQSKWNVIDNFFYLYKIHGSINWIQDNEESKLFKVREIQETSLANLQRMETVMIHPTPLKQNASLGSPYSDLFREFQKKLMQNNNVLVTIGYSFSDEHINNLIYQAFTIPSFRLIVLGNPAPDTEIIKLKSLNDPRIWIIGGDLDNGSKLHYFNGFVAEILPDLSNDEIDSKMEQAIKILLKKNE